MAGVEAEAGGNVVFTPPIRRLADRLVAEGGHQRLCSAGTHL
ncbi:hypothetical protein [Mycobacterium decipiens]|nr:hypothetical protein [Mycobacterium decipiens]